MINKPVFYKKLPTGHFSVFSQKPNFDFVEVHQVHGNIIVEANDSGNSVEGDGLITLHPSNIALAIKTADCLPICVVGEKGYALLHAGWRGIAKNIMISSTLDTIAPKYFLIGPSIQKESFEVSDNFIQEFPGDSEFFTQRTFDLQGVVKKRLHNKYPKAVIESCAIDTYTDHHFFSYRRDKTPMRNWNLFTTEVYW